MIGRLKNYWHVWKLSGSNALQVAFVNRGTNLFFLLGKVFRFLIGLLFLLLIKQKVTTLGGYTSDEMIVFFLTYQLVDSISQALLHNVYIFGDQVKTGELDFLLIKPLNPLFRILTDKPDINDVLFLLPTIIVSVYLLMNLTITVTPLSALLFIVLFFNALIIALALHIFMVSIAILSVEIEGLIWLYRDLNSLGRFPVTIYHESIRLVLFFIIPIGIMNTVPAQILLNTKTSISLPLVFMITGTLLTLSLQFWQYSLKKYTSASS